MPTDSTFRLSTYLTLALVCAAVGYAEFDLLPEVAFIAGGVIVALAVLFRLETRVELLTIPAANRLGLAIALANITWALFRITGELRHPELPHLNWQLMAVAMFGPLLLTLMPAKLARREKHAGDYWGLHIAALVGAGLAAALAEDPICLILLGLYATCAVWSLSLLYLRRAAGVIDLSRSKRPAVAGVVGGGIGWGLRRAVAFTLVGIGCAVPLYLVTPRSPAAKLDLGKPRVEIGYAADQMIDLNQTGNLQPNEQVAFEVTARSADGSPKTDLSPVQRWRGRMLRSYENGGWHYGGNVNLPNIEPIAQQVFDSWTPPYLGPDQITFRFSIPPGLRGQFLADPVTWAPEQPTPVATIFSSGLRGWVPIDDGRFVSSGRLVLENAPFHYLQVWRPEADPDRSPLFRLTDGDKLDGVLDSLCQNPVPRVKQYADAVLDGLVRHKSLPPNFRDHIRLLPRPEFHEQIARAFTAHLASSPELSYTTNLRRERKDLDPVEDFLFHTKAGHCERFATALALMLRSEGIPAVLILGFKGCEATDEPGRYVVRHEHAHAWVQALVPARGQSLGTHLRQGDWCYWLSLDATPEGFFQRGAGAKGGVIEKFGSWLQASFRDFFVTYTAEQREEAIQAAIAWLSRVEVLASAAALIGMLVLVRHFIRLPAHSPGSSNRAAAVVRSAPGGAGSPRLSPQTGTNRPRVRRGCRRNAPQLPGHLRRRRGSTRLG